MSPLAPSGSSLLYSVMAKLKATTWQFSSKTVHQSQKTLTRGSHYWHNIPKCIVINCGYPSSFCKRTLYIGKLTKHAWPPFPKVNLPSCISIDTSKRKRIAHDFCEVKIGGLLVPQDKMTNHKANIDLHISHSIHTVKDTLWPESGLVQAMSGYKFSYG